MHVRLLEFVFHPCLTTSVLPLVTFPLSLFERFPEAERVEMLTWLFIISFHFISRMSVYVGLLSQLAQLFAFSPSVSPPASAHRSEEVIQRYMEVVAAVPDEVNISTLHL